MCGTVTPLGYLGGDAGDSGGGGWRLEVALHRLSASGELAGTELYQEYQTSLDRDLGDLSALCP